MKENIDENTEIVNGTTPVIDQKENEIDENDLYVPIEESEVRNIFKIQKSGKGQGGIPPKVLKTCYKSIVGIYADIFNESLKSGIVPELWKDSPITPIDKKIVRKMKIYDPLPIRRTLVSAWKKLSRTDITAKFPKMTMIGSSHTRRIALLRMLSDY